jgi:hypothetical protein
MESLQNFIYANNVIVVVALILCVFNLHKINKIILASDSKKKKIYTFGQKLKFCAIIRRMRWQVCRCSVKYTPRKGKS